MSDEQDPMDAIEACNALTNMATFTWHYFRELCGQGFTPEQALALTLAWQIETQRGGRGE